jgi:hypothetical protein
MQDAEDTTHVIHDPSLHNAATIGDSADTYPRFGDWFETRDGWLECPRDLALDVVDVVDYGNVTFPIKVTITSATKIDGEWKVETEISPVE